MCDDNIFQPENEMDIEEKYNFRFKGGSTKLARFGMTHAQYSNVVKISNQKKLRLKNEYILR